jgi:hypothetical protein
MANAREALAFILFMLFAAPAHALSEDSESMLDFAWQVVPENGSFYIQKFPFLGGQGFAVVSDGKVYALFEPGVPVLEEQPITDIARIEAMLSAYYYNEGYNDSLSFSAIHNGLVSVRADHEKGEEACRRITGTDVLPCDSYESCRMACIGTPFCQNFAYSGKPGEFINILLAFENSSKALDSAYLGESMAYSLLLDGATQEEAGAYLDSLSAVRAAAEAAGQSPLFDDYSYCFAPDYAIPVVTNMQLSAKKAYAASEPFFHISEDAAKVRNRTITALDRNLQVAKANARNSARPPMPIASDFPPAPPASASLSLENSILPITAGISLFIAIVAGAYFIYKCHEKPK